MNTKNQDNYENKNIVFHTSAQLKGRRLRMMRALTGFSRQEIYDRVGIATSTIDTWESGRVELTQKSAERVCDAFCKIGVSCSSEWLLSGRGMPPRIMDDVEKALFSEQAKIGTEKFKIETKNIKLHIPPFIDSDVKQELCFFLTLHKNSMFYIFENDFMNSRFKKGDCVAGTKSTSLSDLEGKTVIALLEDKKTIPCKIIKSFGDCCEIYRTSSAPKERVVICEAAEILWHRMSSR